MVKDHSHLIRDLAGWMSKAECDELRRAVADFDTVDDMEIGGTLLTRDRHFSHVEQIDAMILE